MFGVSITLKAFRKHAWLYVMVLPVAIYFILFAYYPLVRGFILSLHEFKILGDSEFIGLDNYMIVLKDPLFWRAMLNTVIIGGGILLIGFAFPIIVAISLNEVINVSFKKITQMIIYIPHLFSWVIIGGIWIYLLSPNGGLVNEIIKFFGGNPIYFFTKGWLAQPLMISTAIWKDMGFLCILYLAAIVGINPELYEAAKIDGATRWQEIRYILIPQLYPTMAVVFILNVLGVLKIFDQIFVMRNSAIASKVDVVMIYTYEKGIENLDMGVATAASVIVILATLIITVIVRKIIGYGQEDT